jgi:hypothetical protein
MFRVLIESARHTSDGRPVPSLICRTSPPTMNPSARSSGEKNGEDAPSVSGTSRIASSSSRRVKRRRMPSRPVTASANVRPSWDTATGRPTVDDNWPSTVSCKRVGTRGAAVGVVARPAPNASPRPTTAAAAIATCRVHDGLTGVGSGRCVPDVVPLLLPLVSRASARSRVDWNLSPGAFSRHRRTTRSSAGGRGPSATGSRTGGSAVRTALIVSAAVARSKGRRPVKSSYSTTPTLKMSLRWSRVCPRTCSGDM